ncbi:MAG: TIGR03986 family type III CRISPR-associated RAMP protein [Methylococcales bacterium]
MKLPEHISPGIASRQGQAPYNFVPLPEAIYIPPGEPFKEHDWLDPKRLHGHIDLEIVTETELYTRCAYPPSEESKPVQGSRARQAFYHHGEEERPVIPGSSLRGMMRSMVEILSYSRITRRPPQGGSLRMFDEQLVHRAVADQLTPTGEAYNKLFLKAIKHKEFYYPSPQVQAGYLEPDSTTGGWRIRPARKHQGTSFVRIKVDILQRKGFPLLDNETRDIWLKPAPVKSYPHRGGLVLHYARSDDMANSAEHSMVRGVLIYSGPIGSRHMHTAIYEPDMSAKPIRISEKLWEQFCEDRDQQRGIACRKIKKKGDPLFYLLDSANKLVFFGPTLFFRLPYQNCTGDYVPPDTVDANGPLDLAELIFGTVNGEREDGKSHSGAHKGRVQFDDAVFVSTPDGTSPFLEGQDGIRWPSVLSSPKPTSYQNYLVQTDPEGRKEKLLSYSSEPKKSAGQTVLRGFKRYWHRGSANEDLHLGAKSQHIKQYTVIRLVKPQVTFRCRVRFENLTSLELGALLAAIDLPKGFRHHLGMGKPLGMGSVHIRTTISLIDPVARYQSLAARGSVDQEIQLRKIEDAREEFGREIVTHHNSYTPEAQRVASDARLWDIPRLRALGFLLDWENRPLRHKTAYLPDPKDFRSRQVLPTPAAVLGKLEFEKTLPTSTPRLQPKPRPHIIETTPVLKTLQTLLEDDKISQRQRLEAIDEKLLAQLDALTKEQREAAWSTINRSIGSNKKTRDRLKEIETRLIADYSSEK